MGTAGSRHAQSRQAVAGREGNQVVGVFEQLGVDPRLGQNLGRVDTEALEDDRNAKRAADTDLSACTLALSLGLSHVTSLQPCPSLIQDNKYRRRCPK
jgi:hypothetical protein